MNKIIKYLEYRKNRKIVKRELANIGATFLPVISNAGNITNTIVKFITKVSKELNNIENEKFFELLLDELSDIFTYIVQLSPKEIHAIITDAIINTSDNI